MKKAIWMLLMIPLAWGAAEIAETGRCVRNLEEGVIRLHVRADSDSTADQTAKLAVRDAVFAHAEAWMPEGGDYAAQLSALKAALPEIRAAAEDALRGAGVSDAVAADVHAEHFPARQYGEVTLPEGDYQALCIEIGEGAGQNWWCVMYPGLCLPAAEERDTLAAHFDGETVTLAAQPEKYEIRLKCVELWRALTKKLFQNDVTDL